MRNPRGSLGNFRRAVDSDEVITREPERHRNAGEHLLAGDIAGFGVERALDRAQVVECPLRRQRTSGDGGAAGGLGVIDEPLAFEPRIIERLAGRRLDLFPVMPDVGFCPRVHRPRLAGPQPADNQTDRGPLAKQARDRIDYRAREVGGRTDKRALEMGQTPSTMSTSGRRSRGCVSSWFHVGSGAERWARRRSAAQ